MPIPSRYNRSPLMNMALTPLNDNAVKITDPLYYTLCGRTLRLLAPENATPMQCVAATILGGWDTPPEQPDLEGADPLENPWEYAQNLAACEMIAMLSRSREELSYVHDKLVLWSTAMETMPEEDVFATGTVMLRMLADYYCRTGDRLALTLAEKYRSRLPNVPRFMAALPIQTAFVPEGKAGNENNGDQNYGARMARFAMHPGQSLSMCVQLARFTGSLTTTEAVGKGFEALVRYHGQANGALAQDPFLGGKNPSGATSLEGVCEWIDGLCDALLLTGEGKYAHQLDMLLENVLPELICEGGVRSRCRVNCLSTELPAQPTSRQMTAILQALLSLRRCMICRSNDTTVDIPLHRSGDYRFRLGEETITLRCAAEGFANRDIRLKVECKTPLRLVLRLRVPDTAGSATLMLNGADPRDCPVGQTARINRTFTDGDEITLQLRQTPYTRPGYRSSVSVYCGITLMALPLPELSSEFRYALPMDGSLREGSFRETPAALAKAVFAPEWQINGNEILPPPPGVRPKGNALELTLLPCAGLNGRIGVMPCAK